MKPRRAGPLLHAIGSVVLRYPDRDVVAARPRVAALGELLPDAPASASLRRFLGWWRDAPPTELTERYVATFDLGKRTSLYLTWYLHGDRRQRGQEFVRLKRMYEAAGRRLTGRELPDFLPLVLEFAAVEPEAGASVLAELQVGLELLRAALHDADSVYAPAVDAIAGDLAPLDEHGWAVVRRIAAEGPPGEQVGLEPFGPPEVMPAVEGAAR
ncbi:MAG TPA: nitrate reductase molybdenum cofactor assembly chaperone [Candidatus Limnocylindrales bacterium]|nr:nitrate reductase molybdenum cofactor assembly chaperone [Candidatus Limnocylindrales bacterium]